MLMTSDTQKEVVTCSFGMQSDGELATPALLIGIFKDDP